ncbi:MAG TPA: LuxR C-terminal-related transcriptional regulator [Thermoleophilaceae bacterium]
MTETTTTVLVSERAGSERTVALFDLPSDALMAAFEAAIELGTGARFALDTSAAGRGDPHAAIARCDALRAVANDGAVLLSRATRDLVAGELPPGAGLADLGVHRLPDLGPPERVYHLTHPELRGETGPLRSLGSHPANLPGDLPSFVGRERELAELRETLPRTRLLTLTGAGGCGKTRLALQAAAYSLDRFSDGVWWAELASLRAPAQIGQALADVLEVRPLPGESALDAAARRLRSGRALVLLDNCEHLAGAVGETAAVLLERCPELTVLVTSRAPLGLAGETTWRVPSLPAEEAARLFAERARRVSPGFAVPEAGEPTLTRVCSELDGMPLAIELAAARVRFMSLDQIAAGLADRFRLLTGGARAAPARHRTLRASLDWSHELLDEEERVLLRQLAVFEDRFTIEALEAVGAQEPRSSLDTLAALVDKSLVVPEQHGRVTRYRLLETVREYALERLAEAGETDAARDRHLSFFLALAEDAGQGSPAALDPDRLTHLEANAANLAAALDQAIETDADRARRLCVALLPLWKTRGMFATAEDACMRTLAAGSEPSPLRAPVLWGHGYLLAFAGRGAEAMPVLEEALAVAGATGDGTTEARALGVLGMIRHNFDPLGARPLEVRSREQARKGGDDWCHVAATHALAWSYLVTDDYREADRLFEAALPAAEALGYHEGLAWIYAGMSYRQMIAADAGRLADLGGRAIAAARAVGEPVTEGVAHWQMARLEIARGRTAEALARIEASRERLVASGAGMALPQTYVQLAAIRATLGETDRALATLRRVVDSGVDYGWNLAWAILQYADVLRTSGDEAGAEAEAHSALRVARRVQSAMAGAWSKEILGRLATGRGQLTEAENHLQAALATRAERGLRLWLPQSLEALAEVAAARRSHDEAVRLLGAAARARSELTLVRWAPDAPRLAALEGELRSALGDDAFAAAWQQGESLSAEDAVAWTRRGRGSRRRPPGGWESLTPTELEVVRRAAAGLTNREIAAQMFVTSATVKTHLSHVYAKLGVRNRVELTALAAQRSAMR